MNETKVEVNENKPLRILFMHFGSGSGFERLTQSSWVVWRTRSATHLICKYFIINSKKNENVEREIYVQNATEKLIETINEDATAHGPGHKMADGRWRYAIKVGFCELVNLMVDDKIFISWAYVWNVASALIAIWNWLIEWVLPCHSNSICARGFMSRGADVFVTIHYYCVQCLLTLSYEWLPHSVPKYAQLDEMLHTNFHAHIQFRE